MDACIISAVYAEHPMTEVWCDAANFGIVYVEKGCVGVEADMESCQVERGQIVVIRRNTDTLGLKTSENFKGYFLQIANLSSLKQLRQYDLQINDQNDVLCVVSVDKQKKSILTILESVVAEMNEQWDGRSEFLNLLLQELLQRTCCAKPVMTAVGYIGKYKIVSIVQHRLETEYDRPINLTQIAKEHNISASYLSHIFKEITGVTIMGHLLNCRIQAAKEYLSQSSVPILEIAEKCGFGDYSSFGRAFKKETGNSPLQYRQEHSL